MGLEVGDNIEWLWKHIKCDGMVINITDTKIVVVQNYPGYKIVVLDKEDTQWV